MNGLCLFLLIYLSKLMIQANGYFTILYTILDQDNTTLRPNISTNEHLILRRIICLRTALLTTDA